MSHDVSVRRVEGHEDRAQALAVLQRVYVDEKRWVRAADRNEQLLPEADLQTDQVSWFLATLAGEPVGVVRVLYQLPLDLYREYGFKLLDGQLDVERFLRQNRIAEVGRFGVVAQQRGRLMVAAALMRAAATDTFRRGFTHYITDVFENEPNSPYEFHTRVLGFVPVATHAHGELLASNRRITMLLDLRRAYERLRAKRSWLARYIFATWDDRLHAIAAGA